ncbi:hypothetical protein Taro_002005, partial [Colocasia esculenta]|nr:hypothetical protein [Colocasia esculenta]
APGGEEASPTPEDCLWKRGDWIWAEDHHLFGLTEEGFIAKFDLLRFLFRQAMASCGRHGAQARDDEQRREERGEQQAPAPQGPTVLPHNHLWIMAYSCKAWSKQCRLRRHCRLSCRHRLRLQFQFLRSMSMVVRPSWRGLRGWLHLLLRGRVSPSWQRTR